jgi:acyl dehydratase
VDVTLAELEQAGALDLGAGSWVAVPQESIDLFADATGDRQWIHVDPEAAAQGPFGTTVAHGYLTLAMVPMLLEELLTVTDAGLGINYGIDKLRFPAPVPAGSRVRLRARVVSSEPRGGGTLYRIAVEVEIEGGRKPALAGEVLYLFS